METKIEELKAELVRLQKALKNSLVSVNEYCDAYYAISQQIKKITE